MLSLEPPFHLIEGVSLYRDHADPLQWYFLPLGPRLTTVADPATGAAVPQLNVIKFRGTSGDGGFLNFDVDLGIDPEVLDQVRRKLRRAEDLDDEPRLAPVPLVDGSVRMMLFDAESGTAPEEDEGDRESDDAAADRPRFTLAIDHAAKPALYGDNRAAFSVQLSPEGVTVLEKALAGEMSPIGVVYSLDFLALRPAYQVQIDVDWDRVQSHFEEHFRTEVPFIYRSEISEIVDQLIDQQVILIDVDTFVVEGEESSGVLARRDQAVADVQDMITESFFEPSLDPMAAGEVTDGVDDAARVMRTIVSLGASEQTAFQYVQRDIQRIDRKRLDVNMRERVAVKRSVFPQGHLAGLFRVLRRPDIDLERFVLAVDTDDPWFERRQVRVISRADFAGDSIASVDVHLEYGGRTRNVLLEPGKLEQTIDWASRLSGGVVDREVRARYKVRFQGVDGTDRPILLESPDFTFRADNLEIDPRQLYSLLPVPIIALGMPWERYPQVEVEVRYDDAENGITQSESFRLDADSHEITWKMFVRDPAHTAFRYRVIFRGADHRDIDSGWKDCRDERLVLRDPHPQKLEVAVVPVFDWSVVDRAFVDLAYRDPANGLLREESFEFTEAENKTRRFEVALHDPEHRRVSYRVTVIQRDSAVIEIPESQTLERRITVRGDLKGHRIVRIATDEGDFSTARLRDITVHARYQDGDAGLSFADSFVFRTAGDGRHFEYDFVDPEDAAFEYQVVRRFSNGLSRETPWQTGAEGDLVIALEAS